MLKNSQYDWLFFYGFLLLENDFFGVGKGYKIEKNKKNLKKR